MDRHAFTDSVTACMERIGVEALRKQVIRLARTPAFAIAAISPVVFAACVDATGPESSGASLPVRNTAVAPVAVVNVLGTEPDGPALVAVIGQPSMSHVAVDATPTQSTDAARPLAAVGVTKDEGPLGIPEVALAAYRKAERHMANVAPACGINWSLLAGIGRIESMHARSGATDEYGTALQPIYGPVLDGSLPGNEVVAESSTGDTVTYARAIGPMQFLPDTWARYAADGNGDGRRDPQNIFDAALAAAHYLCSGGLNLRNQSQVLTAVLRYNHSMGYVHNVLGWAAAYADGTIPVDLPAVTDVPPINRAHLAHSKGLGPDLPANLDGAPTGDLLLQLPLIDLGQVSPPPESAVVLDSPAPSDDLPVADGPSSEPRENSSSET